MKEKYAEITRGERVFIRTVKKKPVKNNAAQKTEEGRQKYNFWHSRGDSEV